MSEVNLEHYRFARLRLLTRIVLPPRYEWFFAPSVTRKWNLHPIKFDIRGCRNPTEVDVEEGLPIEEGSSIPNGLVAVVPQKNFEGIEPAAYSARRGILGGHRGSIIHR